MLTIFILNSALANGPLPVHLQPPVGAAAGSVWRPTIDDVDRISWGRPAKQKGTGSRGVPHRLNDEERSLYDFARRKGFVEIGGSGWRRQRSDAPLVNTYRSWCDARGHPAIYLHKASDGVDEVVADLSPLRTPTDFEAAAAFCLADAPDGLVEFEVASGLLEEEEKTAAATSDAAEQPPVDGDAASGQPSEAGIAGAAFDLGALADAYRDEPIYRLPMFAVAWTRPRAEAKVLAKSLAQALGTAEATKKGEGVGKGRKKVKGAPRVKPGKSRQHGGYGIG
jgi:hypothetical protein